MPLPVHIMPQAAKGLPVGSKVAEDFCVGRHTGFQLVVGIVNAYFDGEYQVDALLLRLNVLGGELCLGRDVGDCAFKYPVGIGIYVDLDSLPFLDSSDLGFGNEHG